VDDAAWRKYLMYVSFKRGRAKFMERQMSGGNVFRWRGKQRRMKLGAVDAATLGPSN